MVPPEYLLEFDVGTVIQLPFVVTCCQEIDELAKSEGTLHTSVMEDPYGTVCEL